MLLSWRHGEKMLLQFPEEEEEEEGPSSWWCCCCCCSTRAASTAATQLNNAFRCIFRCDIADQFGPRELKQIKPFLSVECHIKIAVTRNIFLKKYIKTFMQSCVLSEWFKNTVKFFFKFHVHFHILTLRSLFLFEKAIKGNMFGDLTGSYFSILRPPIFKIENSYATKKKKTPTKKWFISWPLDFQSGQGEEGFEMVFYALMFEIKCRSAVVSWAVLSEDQFTMTKKTEKSSR